PPGKVGAPAPEATSATSVAVRVGPTELMVKESSSVDQDSAEIAPTALHGRKARFEVVYRLMSLDLESGMPKARCAVKTRVADGEAMPRSAMDLFGNADWFEREVWDMFGVPFADRPGMKRLLMYEEFVGHPLRKDYAIHKRQPLIGPASG